MPGCFSRSPNSPQLRPRASLGSALGRSQDSSQVKRALGLYSSHPWFPFGPSIAFRQKGAAQCPKRIIVES